MRLITDHIVGGLNEPLEVLATDEPGAGGANHRYVVNGFNTATNSSLRETDESKSQLVVLFQNGPLKETLPNGVSVEALLAICIDRLKSFQAGPFTSKENAVALTHIQTGLLWLQQRTRDRVNRGVEGQNKQ